MRLHPHPCEHTTHRHRPVFVEIQVLVAGEKKADGQVDLPHCTHGEGRHHRVGEPTQTTEKEEIHSVL